MEEGYSLNLTDVSLAVKGRDHQRDEGKELGHQIEWPRERVVNMIR